VHRVTETGSTGNHLFNIAPASTGPTIELKPITVMFSALAAGNWWLGSIRGIAAERVGEFTAQHACCKAQQAQQHLHVVDRRGSLQP
jgi:hypothetical protein